VICRVPAAMLATLVDTNDTECLEVRHCMNNSCDQHALQGDNTGHAASDTSAAEPEDVSKLPFFLIPRCIGPHVARRMLRHRPKSIAVDLSSPGELRAKHALSPPSLSMHAAADSNGAQSQHGPPRFGGRRHKRGKAKVHGRTDTGACRPSEADALLEGSFGEREVWETGCFWDVEEKRMSERLREAGHEVGAAEEDACMDGEEAREVLEEVECTLVDLGLWSAEVPAQ
jgi:hypothetical protein